MPVFPASTTTMGYPKMEPSLPDNAKSRVEVCDRHGDYESRHLVSKLWSRCPVCAEVAAAEREQEEFARAKAAAERRHQRALDEARIPERFRSRSFAEFIADSDAKRRALTTVRDYAERMDEHLDRGTGLVLIGGPGTGKTHLAISVLLSTLGRRVMYATCSDLVKMVRDTWRKDSPRSESQVFALIEDLDLLVIDEMGAQAETDNLQSLVFQIIDARYREQRPTIIVTNQDRVGLKGFVGERSFDRLAEICRFVVFDWPSFRSTARKLSMAERGDA
jgi:DNA replication protein DnaC